MTKWSAALVCLACLGACTFPDFELSSAPRCDDGIRNGDETGIDCGLLACSIPCPAGQGCSSVADCIEGVCGENKICRSPECDDGVTNGQESDADCGGGEGCDRCTVGDRCRELSDCDGGRCTNGQCSAPTCKDKLTNALETDVDCGGLDCNACQVGQACNVTSDCDGVACSKGTCQPASCADAIQNQDETDLDCGGSCSGCAVDQGCAVGADCESGVCPSQARVCAAPSCSDGVKNGDEPSPDCGGSCTKKCAVLAACSGASDCETQSCLRDVCVPLAPSGVALSPVGWVPTASHTYSNSATSFAIDGLQNSDWTSGTAQTPGMWFDIDLGSPQVFFSIEIDCQSAKDDVAEALDIWFSDDGTFTTRAKQNLPGMEQTVIEFAEPQVARYIRISLAQGNDHWWRMDEIRVKQ